MTTPDSGTPEPGPDASIDDIQADIEATRSELGQTVEALTAKLDVKQQAKDKVDATKTQLVGAATDDQGAVRPVLPVAAFAIIAVIIGIVVWKRRR